MMNEATKEPGMFDRLTRRRACRAAADEELAKHLAECEQCRDNPFAPCVIGWLLSGAEVRVPFGKKAIESDVRRKAEKLPTEAGI